MERIPDMTKFDLSVPVNVVGLCGKCFSACWSH